MAESKKIKTKKNNIKKASLKKVSAKKTVTKRKKSSKVKQVETSEDKVALRNNEQCIVLKPITIINEIKLLHANLVKLSACDETVTIDASKVEMIDTAAIQLLVAFVSTMNSKKVAVEWEKPSEGFLERVSMLNLNEILCLTETNA